MADEQPVKEKIVYVERKRRGCMLPLLVILGLAVVGGGIYAVTQPKPQTATNVPGGTTVPITAQPGPALSELLSQKTKLTDAQWDAYAETVKGKSLTNWVGTVTSVDQKLFSNDIYTMIVDVPEGAGAQALFDVLVDVGKDDALKINKGQSATVNGLISKIDCLANYCRIELTNASYTLK